ncbi:DUF7125 family protein [Natranaeroarchaeum aerophilus]|uniref:P-loop NTPase n=1 Tax=Natranaeroarchaeum aerophilus TaxID=2917711 RepID=A0AAE3K466_9EURY|nr:P-loop NTPase [Natranaeroarchaeum aerophilus]MCL9812891.1 P-loop NTPase [Natranaeroarchaeum aerophilus]
MIAITGAKGGCGKSTVTVGLARAFARSETSAITVDADRQLPNLHVMTGLDREPTLAELKRGQSLDTIAQTDPESPTVGVVPAPKPSQPFEFEPHREAFDTDGTQLLVDCPSGAGPDVVEPVRQADGVIVVATDTDRGLDAAETSIELARRLDVPVYGAVLNQCSEVPTQANRWEGVPLLGCVPDRPSPLLNQTVEESFDEIVTRLSAQSAADRSLPEYGGDRLPVGTPELDDQLDGGVPPGSIVALVGEPSSQAEQLLYSATDVRGTLYISTLQPRGAVRQSIDTTGLPTGNPTIREVGGETPIEDATELIEKLPNAANLIIDGTDPLEQQDRSTYLSFLGTLKERLVDTDSIGLLHCLGDSSHRRTATLRAADIVLEFETIRPGIEGDAAHYVTIPKYRPADTATEPVTLTFATDSRTGPIESPTGSN